MSDVRATLLAAADLIEPEGAWYQLHGSRVNSDGSVSLCALIAIYRATDLSSVGLAASLFVRRHLGLSDSEGLAGWNDAPERTQAEVVAALRAAASEAPA